MKLEKEVNEEKYKIPLKEWLKPLIPIYGFFYSCFGKEINNKESWVREKYGDKNLPPKKILKSMTKHHNYSFWASLVISIVSIVSIIVPAHYFGENQNALEKKRLEENKKIAIQMQNEFYNKTFQSYDLNKNNTISKDEFFKRYDKNNSKTLDFVEFMNLLNEMDSIDRKGKKIYWEKTRQKLW